MAGLRWAAIALIALGIARLCGTLPPRPMLVAPAHARPHGAVDPATLTAPARSDEPDVDLFHEWESAGTSQELLGPDARWTFRPYTNLVALDGTAHRALVLLPSARGEPSLAYFKVAVPAGAAAELVAWVTIEPRFATWSDGVEFGYGVGDAAGNPRDVALTFERIPGKRVSPWRKVRIDLAPFAGRTMWVILASREGGKRSGDWLLWGDPRLRSYRYDDAATIDVAAPASNVSDGATGGDAAAAGGTGVARPGRPPWSEATVFKPYSLFNDFAVGALGDDWVRRSFPWLASARIFSALGANWGPSLDRDYDAFAPSAEANLAWEAGWKGRFEFFRDDAEHRDVPIASAFDWRQFDTLVGNAVRSGLALNLNLAGAPERFTGGRGLYKNYHYNELPVIDEAGWREYVRALFAHLAGEPWFPSAEFSFFTEPNCLWTDDAGATSHVGFQGTAEQFARQYLWTWQAAKPYLRPGQLHFGPFVVEHDPRRPQLDNLRQYVRAVKQAFAAAGEPLPPWSAFAFNVYETPQLSIEHVGTYKLRYVRQLLREELPDVELPVRFDEVGVHPLVASDFIAATGVRLDATKWETAWHAEMLALLLDQHVERAASWLAVFMATGAVRPYLSYVALSAAVGAAGVATDDGTFRVTAAEPDDGLRRAVVQRSSARNDRIGWVASRDARGTVHAALWRLPRYPAVDARLADEDGTRVAEIRLGADDAGGWSARVTGYDEPALIPDGSCERRALAVAGFPTLPPVIERACTGTSALRVALAPGDVVLVELTAAPRR